MTATLRLLLQAARAWLPASSANVGIIHAFELGDQLALQPLCEPLGSNHVNNYGAGCMDSEGAGEGWVH